MASVYQGVTINNLRQAFMYLYFGVPANMEERDRFLRYVLPMQQNFMNPIEVDTDDTYIMVIYDDDKKITQDAKSNATEYTLKLAECAVRFVGAQAELWAKRFHHIDDYPEAYKIFLGTCQGEILPYIGSIRPTNAQFFGKNYTLAFDVDFKIEYHESVDLEWLPLKSVTVPPGQII